MMLDVFAPCNPVMAKSNISKMDDKFVVCIPFIVFNISHTLVGNKIVDHSDVVGASPVGAAPTTSSFST